MPNEKAPQRTGKKHARRRALTVAAAATTATAMAFGLAPTAAAIQNRALAYDLFSDFPGTVNPVTFANAIVQTVLQPQFIGQLPVCAECEDLIGDVAYKPHPDGGYVLVPEYNALLFPLRGLEIATTQIAAVTEFDIAGIPVIGKLPALLTAIANANEDTYDILIDIGYSDVDKLTFKRAYDQFGGEPEVFIFDHPFGFFDYLAALKAAAESAIEGTEALVGGITADLGNPISAGSGARIQPSDDALQQDGSDLAAEGDEDPAIAATVSRFGDDDADTLLGGTDDDGITTHSRKSALTNDYATNDYATDADATDADATDADALDTDATDVDTSDEAPGADAAPSADAAD